MGRCTCGEVYMWGGAHVGGVHVRKCTCGEVGGVHVGRLHKITLRFPRCHLFCFHWGNVYSMIITY